MRLPQLASLGVILLGSASCSSGTRVGAPIVVPQTIGEMSSGFGYVPLDGLAIREERDYTTCPYLSDSVKSTYGALLRDLPDINVRFAVASVAFDGGLSFGPARLTDSGSTYRAVLDYVNIEAVPQVFFI